MSRKATQITKNKQFKRNIPVNSQTTSVGFDHPLKSFKLQVLIIFVLSWILYSNTLMHQFALDDYILITLNTYTKKGIDGIKEILTNDAFTGFFNNEQNILEGGRYRPISQIMFAIEYELFGLNPFVGHFINVLLYSLSCVFLLSVLRRLFIKFEENSWYLSIPFIATLIYTIHPLHTESIANIKGRDEILSILCLLSILYFTFKYIDSNEKRKWIYLLAVFFVYIIGLLSKEIAVTFLAVVPLTLFVFTNSNLKSHFIYFSPLFAGFIIYLLIRKAALGFVFFSGVAVSSELMNNPYLDATSSEKYATIFYTWGVYLKLLFFPHPLTHDYYPKHIPLKSWGDLSVILSFLFFLTITVWAIIMIWKKNIIAYGILFFLIVFSISSNLIINIGSFMNERFLFIPMIGFAIIFAYFLNKLPSKIFNNQKIPKTLVFGFILVFTLLFSIKAISRNADWYDYERLAFADIKVSYKSAKINATLGEIFLVKGNNIKNTQQAQTYFKKSLSYLDQSVKIHPNYFSAWELGGRALFGLKNYTEACQYYQRALKINPGYKVSENNFYLALSEMAKNCKTENDLNEIKNSAKILPIDDIRSKYVLAIAYSSAQKIDNAINELEAIFAKSDTFNVAYVMMGQIYGRYLNNMKSAEYYLQKAIEKKPNNSLAYENLGIVYGMKQDYEKSLEYLKKALEFKSENEVAILNNIGITYRLLGNEQKAKEYLSRAEKKNE